MLAGQASAPAPRCASGHALAAVELHLAAAAPAPRAQLQPFWREPSGEHKVPHEQLCVDRRRGFVTLLRQDALRRLLGNLQGRQGLRHGQRVQIFHCLAPASLSVNSSILVCFQRALFLLQKLARAGTRGGMGRARGSAELRSQCARHMRHVTIRKTKAYTPEIQTTITQSHKHTRANAQELFVQ